MRVRSTEGMASTLVTETHRPTTTRAGAATRGMVLVVGLGSAGKRHLDNLRALGHADVATMRTGLGTRPLEGSDTARVHRDLDVALAQEPLAVVVANPTALHLGTALG